jgi:hypothetical protein
MGTHEELYLAGGTYRKLFESQFNTSADMLQKSGRLDPHRAAVSAKQ